jgi:uncharacterized SAM-dependent methyltransferase
MPFVIRRAPLKGQLNPVFRYKTVGYGWTANFDLAKRYPTREEAEAENLTRDEVLQIINMRAGLDLVAARNRQANSLLPATDCSAEMEGYHTSVPSVPSCSNPCPSVSIRG